MTRLQRCESYFVSNYPTSAIFRNTTISLSTRFAVSTGKPTAIQPLAERLAHTENHFISLRTRNKFGSQNTVINNMETIKKTIAENLGGIAQKAAPGGQQFDIEHDVPDLSNKVAVVTGGSEGIGYAASFMMLKNKLSKLFIVSLSQEVYDGAVKDVSDKLGAEYAQKMAFVQCDLNDLPSVVQAAKQIRDGTDRLDILVLNAARGIMTYQQQRDGIDIDRHMMVNHIGHVTLTSHVLPLLKATAAKSSVRISIQASNAHEMAPKDTRFASIDELNQDLGPNGQYGRSKLAGILYARYLARHLSTTHSNIFANATHPGIVETKMSVEDIHEPYPVLGYGMSVVMKPLKKDQWEGSASTLFAATKTTGTGDYICPPAIVEPGSELSRDEQLGERLMKLTREIVRQKYAAESVDKGCPLSDY